MGLVQARQNLSAGPILLNNLRATVVVLLGGLVSFSVLGIMAYLANVSLVGVVLAVFNLIGYSPLRLFAAGILPHGLFEIPALILTSAAALRMGAVLVTPQTGKSMGQVILEVVADCAQVFLGLVIPLLVIAAFIEAYITPSLLISVLK